MYPLLNERILPLELRWSVQAIQNLKILRNLLISVRGTKEQAIVHRIDHLEFFECPKCFN
jgi:hypothetical protein